MLRFYFSGLSARPRHGVRTRTSPFRDPWLSHVRAKVNSAPTATQLPMTEIIGMVLLGYIYHDLQEV